MTRWTIRVLVALATFSLGLASAKLVILHGRPASQSFTINNAKAPEPESDSSFIKFENTGDIDMNLTYYRSSDGAGVQYGCFEEGYLFSLARDIPVEDRYVHIVEHTPKFNAKGIRVGERIVSLYARGLDMRAEISWTEGSRSYLISAPTLRYALAFEKSKVWADGGCMDFNLMHMMFELKPPRNTFHPTAQVK